MPIEQQIKIAVIGLGYVGLPLAVSFSNKFEVTAFDINQTRIDELTQNFDRTGEVDGQILADRSNLKFTSLEVNLSESNVYIVTVPTPVDKFNAPNLGPLCEATRLIGYHLKPGDFVVYESTVFPGATEEVCVPILEKISGLKLNQNFYVGYSPERINPGDKKNTLQSITKITSGSNEWSANYINDLYKEIVDKTHLAPSISVAEAAKVIENTQRDVNIGLINELSMLFNTLGIDTTQVLDAAATKWNFLRFTPGLVGGHCIGVDPYYLTHKAAEVGHHTEIVLAGRRINDNMSFHIVNNLIAKMVKAELLNKNTRILILGTTFKENCPDVRNTKVVDIITKLKNMDLQCDVVDPVADRDTLLSEYGIELTNDTHHSGYDAVILAVPHSDFLIRGAKNLKKYLKPNGLFFDLKSVFPIEESDWRL